VSRATQSHEPIHTTALVPLARPLPIAASVSGCLPVSPPLTPTQSVDRCAVASAVCGLTAFIPILSQLAGIVFGCVALRRIAVQRRRGWRTRGTGWAIAGICSSVAVLVGWAGMFVALLALRTRLETATHAVQRVQTLSERAR